MPLKKIHIGLFSLNRHFKRLVLVIMDAAALILALWSAYALRLADLWPEPYLIAGKWLFVTTPILGVLIFIRLGLYRAVLRFLGTQAMWAVFKGVILLSVVLLLLSQFLEIKPFSRSVPINFGLAALLYVGGSRLLLRSYYNWLIQRYVEKAPVLIYGAGGAGVQLSHALHGGAEFMPVGFVDDDRTLWKSSVAGLNVFCPDNLKNVIEQYGVTHILLALPSLSATRKRKILEKLAQYPVHVKTIPAMPELISGEEIGRLRDIKLRIYWVVM